MNFGFFRKKKDEEKKNNSQDNTKSTNNVSNQPKRPLIPPKKRTIIVKRRGGTMSRPVQQTKRADFFMKLILCGDGAVGKTALRERYLGRGFSQSYLQTIGADFATTDKEIIVEGKNHSVQYQIWDLAGQSEFQAVRSSYYEGCYGSFMVFDVTRPESFNNIEKWINELWQNSGKGAVPVILLGNKVDLKDKFPEHVQDAQIKSYLERLNEKCRPYNFSCDYLETSALTGKNVELAFRNLGENVVKWILTKKNA
ncbi:MAG: Rab family GTPase [Candidatus Thorarchaeota archaeon]